jgi:hypothetical protein
MDDSQDVLHRDSSSWCALHAKSACFATRTQQCSVSVSIVPCFYQGADRIGTTLFLCQSVTGSRDMRDTTNWILHSPKLCTRMKKDKAQSYIWGLLFPSSRILIFLNCRCQYSSKSRLRDGSWSRRCANDSSPRPKGCIVMLTWRVAGKSGRRGRGTKKKWVMLLPRPAPATTASEAMLTPGGELPGRGVASRACTRTFWATCMRASKDLQPRDHDESEASARTRGGPFLRPGECDDGQSA